LKTKQVRPQRRLGLLGGESAVVIIITIIIIIVFRQAGKHTAADRFKLQNNIMTKST